MSSRLDYLRDGQAIYARSFAMIRAEADLARFAGAAERVVVRMIHACGMTDLPRDVEVSDRFAMAGEAALKAGAPILCDVRMVADGVTRWSLRRTSVPSSRGPLRATIARTTGGDG